MARGSAFSDATGGIGRAAVVFVPGLTRGLLARGAFPLLESWLGRTPSAGVVPSFPCVPSVVQASVLCAQLPREHGVFGAAWDPSDPATRPLVPTLVDRVPAEFPAASARAIGLAIEVASHVGVSAPRPTSAPPRPPSPPTGVLSDGARAHQLVAGWTDPSLRLMAIALDAVALSLHRAGPRDAGTLAAARETDSLLETIRAGRPIGSALLICGAPAYASVRAAVPISELAARCGAEAHACEGAIARLRIPVSACSAARDRILATPGVERVLDKDAAGSWGFVCPAPGELVVLAEPGWAFLREGSTLPAACAGHPDAADDDEPLALWWGEAESEPWPPRVHDYRLGTTLAQAIGLSTVGLRDRPITG